MLQKYIFVIVFIFHFTSCYKVIYKYDGLKENLSNNFSNDADEIQYLIDNNLIAELENRTYNINKTIKIKKYFQQLRGKGATSIIFNGKGPAILFQESQNGNFPVMNQIRDLSIVVNNKNSTGLEIRSSHSTFDNISIAILSDNSTGFKIMGDKNGTGSYYNLFTKCSVQGNAQLGKQHQIGIDLNFDEAEPNRCPNGNTFWGGRIGQVSKGIVIRGGGNTFYSPVLEGVTEKCFEFDHPSSPVGCVENNVYSPYIEGADGVNVSYFGKNSIGCNVINPFITSIGLKGAESKDESSLSTNGLIRTKQN